MIGTSLPTPLYVIYQAQWHFSSGIVTVIFASYAAGVLVALLLAGRSSDQVGGRPVVLAALGFSAVRTVVFILAPSLGWLFVGRVLSGLSAGLVTGTATAALTETYGGSSSRRASTVATAANLGGLGLGPLIAGLLAQYGPNPTVLVFEVYLGVLAVAALGLTVVPETVTDRQKLNLRFTGLGMPVAGRSEFIAAGVAAFAAFSLLGLFTALAPSFLGAVLHEHSHAVSGVVVFAIFGTAALTQLFLARFPSRPVIMSGLVLFLAPVALICAGRSDASTALCLVGAADAGGGRARWGEEPVLWSAELVVVPVVGPGGRARRPRPIAGAGLGPYANWPLRRRHSGRRRRGGHDRQRRRSRGLGARCRRERLLVYSSMAPPVRRRCCRNVYDGSAARRAR